MKYEWRKEEKEVYFPKEEPSVIGIEKANFVCIKGIGNPNEQDFKNRVEALYTVSYAIRMSHKKGINIPGFYEYTVYPLEGFWDLTEEGRQSEVLLKDQLLYTIMIKQPPFVTKEVFNQIIEMVKAKDKNPLFEEVFFECIQEGLSIQIMHIGSYDEEKRSFDKMKEYLKKFKI